MADNWNSFQPMFGDYIKATDVIMEKLTYVNHTVRDSNYYIGKKEVVIQVLRSDGMPYLISHASSTVLQWLNAVVPQLPKGKTLIFRFTYDAMARAKWGVDYYIESEEKPPAKTTNGKNGSRKAKEVAKETQETDIPF